MAAAPAPNNTRIIARPILTTEFMTIIKGSDFIFRDAISIARNKFTITDVPIMSINMIVKSIPIEGVNNCLKTKINILQTVILEHTISNDALTYTCVSPSFASEKVLPRKRVLPIGTARSIISEKIILRVITVDAIPIISGLVIPDKKNHKIYPAIAPMVVSINRYVAFFPTVPLSIFFHLPFASAFNQIYFSIKNGYHTSLKFLVRLLIRIYKNMELIIHTGRNKTRFLFVLIFLINLIMQQIGRLTSASTQLIY